MSSKFDINDYLYFHKSNKIGELVIKSPVIYSNSFAFNKFNYVEQFADVVEISINIEADLVFDSFLYIILEDLKKYCKLNNIKLKIISSNENFDGLYNFLSAKKSEKLHKEKQNIFIDFFVRIGNSAKHLANDLLHFIEFIGELSIRLIKLPKHFKEVRWIDLPTFLITVGVRSIGICLLIVFLIGIIIGYVGALQLSRFGVGSFLASLVGIAVTRELSPIMVGIIIAGRTGSAFTAEIGTMRVSEEIDALMSFGFDKYNFLVFPRMFATIISLPIIVSICNIAGIIGGYFAGNAVLNITFGEFQMQLLDSSLSYYDVLGGILKSAIFGVIISIVGCFKGFQVSGGAESVGKYTTSSVVTSIFLIVLIDAIFAFLL